VYEVKDLFVLDAFQHSKAMVGEFCMVHPKVIDYFLLDDGLEESVNTGNY
jgi:hypothetical protein